MTYIPLNYEALAAIPIHTVAEIAAKLQLRDADPADSIRRAYILLDAAVNAQRSLMFHKSIDEGLRNFSGMLHSEEERLRQLEVRRADPLYREEAGEALSVAFDDALSQFFARIRKSNREARFIFYLSKETTHRKIQRTDNEVRRIVTDWKQNGIPFDKYFYHKTHLPGWWKSHLSNIQSAKRKGRKKDSTDPQGQKHHSEVKKISAEPAEKTNGKQVRVIRKNDKRKGSKAGSFL